jgi:hypothetical protein
MQELRPPMAPPLPMGPELATGSQREALARKTVPPSPQISTPREILTPREMPTPRVVTTPINPETTLTKPEAGTVGKDILIAAVETAGEDGEDDETAETKGGDSGVVGGKGEGDRGDGKEKDDDGSRGDRNGAHGAGLRGRDGGSGSAGGKAESDLAGIQDPLANVKLGEQNDKESMAANDHTISNVNKHGNFGDVDLLKISGETWESLNVSGNGEIDVNSEFFKWDFSGDEEDSASEYFDSPEVPYRPNPVHP